MSPNVLRAAFLCAAVAFAGAANAASFDCARASAPDEIAICGNPELSELDVRMATLYAVRMKLPMLMGSRGAAKDEQVAFLATRGACGADASCIADAYRARIDALNATLDAALQDYCVKVGICG